MSRYKSSGEEVEGAQHDGRTQEEARGVHVVEDWRATAGEW